MKRRDILKVLPAVVLGRFVTACVVDDELVVLPDDPRPDVPGESVE